MFPIDHPAPDGEPVLEFQPAVDLSIGRLLGFEALVRWRYPRQGLVPPAVLLPWARRHGCMPTLSSWVVSEACAQAATWPPYVAVSVNRSVDELLHHDTSTTIAAALMESGLEPDRLTIEVAETAIADGEAAKDLRALTALGVHLAVKDVGANLSTLENLRRFSIETAKIDRRFIAALEPGEGINRAIVEAIVHVSHSLSITTVAMGIQTVQQVDVLRRVGADAGQGYFFSRPVPPHEARAMAGAEPHTVFSLTTGAAHHAPTVRSRSAVRGNGAGGLRRRKAPS